MDLARRDAIVRLSALVFVWCHTLAPYTNVRPMARAIAHATRSSETAAVLSTIAFYENTLSPHRGVPFGACARLCRSHCTDCRTEPLGVTARAMSRLWSSSRRCGYRLEVRLGWYHSGRCAADAFSRNEAQTVQRLMEVRR